MDMSVDAQQTQLEREAQRLVRLADTKYARNISLFNPSISDIELLIDAAAQEISGLASPDHVIDVFRHNPECFWALSRVKSDGRAVEWPEGFFAILPLNREGASALIGGRLDTAAPELRYICRQWEAPEAIYFWCIYAPGPLAAGISLWANHYCSPKFEGTPVFAKAGTAAGAHFFERLGFKRGASWNGVRNDDLISLLPPAAPRREARADAVNRDMPAYDNYEPRYGLTAAADSISCSVVASLDELLQTMAIRSVVYIGDQHCPFGEEWDGNDLTAIHILARKGDEPIGAIRLRTFAGFAKIERLCVLPAYRRSRAAFKLERAGSELARAMGYTRLIGHAQRQVLRFWKAQGWREIEGRENFVFSDHECVQISKAIVPHVNAVKFDSEPLTLVRPVGRWHVEGPLDKSAARPALNASRDADSGQVSQQRAA